MDGAATQAGLDTSKPFYFNFDRPACVFLFEKMLTGKGGQLQFTEMLPSSKSAASLEDGRQHISEFVTEIYQELH